jgi:hypothetical protein
MIMIWWFTEILSPAELSIELEPQEYELLMLSTTLHRSANETGGLCEVSTTSKTLD